MSGKFLILVSDWWDLNHDISALIKKSKLDGDCEVNWLKVIFDGEWNLG